MVGICIVLPAWNGMALVSTCCLLGRYRGWQPSGVACMLLIARRNLCCPVLGSEDRVSAGAEGVVAQSIWL